MIVAKPPKTTPHSDLDGIHEDERRNVDVAVEAGQDSADLDRARNEGIGRPKPGKAGKGGDDRPR